MRTKTLFIASLVAALGTWAAPPVCAQGDLRQIEQLIERFPNLDAMERTLRSSGQAYLRDGRMQARTSKISDGIPSALSQESQDTDTKNEDPPKRNVEKYLLDRWGINARNSYGRRVGFLGPDISFTERTAYLKPSYTMSFSPTLPEPKFVQNNPRLHGFLWQGWTLKGTGGEERELRRPFTTERFSQGLRFTWSVELNYQLKYQQLRQLLRPRSGINHPDQQTLKGPSAQQSVFLNSIIDRVDAMSHELRNTRLQILREIYPRFELHLTKYREAITCEEKTEQFFTMKGLALGMLTVAGYDDSYGPGLGLVTAWKSASHFTCEKH